LEHDSDYNLIANNTIMYNMNGVARARARARNMFSGFSLLDFAIKFSYYFIYALFEWLTLMMTETFFHKIFKVLWFRFNWGEA